MDLDKLEKLAKQEMLDRDEHEGREPGWLYFHGRRVGKLAVWLAKELGADVDPDVLYVAGLFHDIGKGEADHALAGAKKAGKLLKKLCTEQELEQIAELIEWHNRRGEEGRSLAVGIIQDADILDHVGPVGPWLAYYWSGRHVETFADHLHYYHSEENTQTRQRLYAHLNFEASQREYIRRVQYEDAVIQTLERVYEQGVWEAAGQEGRRWSPQPYHEPQES